MIELKEISIQEIINKLNSYTNFDNSTNCWLFLGAKNSKGYGTIRFGNKTYSPHRLSAYCFLKLDLEDISKHALHKLECPNKNCWNWNHLYVGDNLDNQNDKKLAGNSKKGLPVINKEKTHCLNSHPLSGDNLYIAKDGRRRCNQCRRNNTKRFDDKKKEHSKQIIKRKQLKVKEN